jgi:hypothetical protein
MRDIKQVGFLPLALTGSGRNSRADGRVLDLFRNRAELKKAYSGAQSELQQWKDRLKQQEGAMARVQEALQALELRLAKPDTGLPTLVYYQMRELWAFGQSLLEQFVDELRTQREVQEREAFRREAIADLERRRAEHETALNTVHAATASAGTAVSRVRQLLQQQQAWWQYFQRRALQRRLHAALAEAALAETELNAALAQRDVLAIATQKEFPGLSVGARRAVNAAAITYAHVLYDRLADSSAFDAVCRAVKLREPPDEEYGDRASCERLMAEIQRARALLEQRATLNADMHRTGQQLKPLMCYDSAEDSVPAAAALLGTPTQPGSPVLQANAWQINRLLLR